MMIPKTTSVCPHCRKKQGPSLIQVIVIIIVFLIIGSCIKGIMNAPSPEITPAITNKEKEETNKKTTRALAGAMTRKKEIFLK